MAESDKISDESLSNEATGQRGCGRGRMAPMGQGVIPKEPGASCQVAPGPLMSLWEAVKEKVKFVRHSLSDS
ncbi:hypothetical protein DAPPUDRAFT_242173 [Daphnia pulex]|uniref:Uncharacterized protein n=1 Tax=Daphnia pulex TaxID=6669 RepID=E9GG19_DAPPU|nr:hypothetical protein DAPPUDRAFT_242173 [Daphnia pulex]|eukprot:EFX81323.1 hypothetical protein DAPPUDRAFT_242173 [Daphnia pulex]